MKRFALLLVFPALALATVPWSQEEIIRNTWTAPYVPHPTALAPRPLSRYSYLYEIRQTCDFIALHQFPDSSKPDSFGGIIEAEHMPTTIETDNTQEAIWIWTRWFELTGLDSYRSNIRRAWYYVLRHPAYREGAGQYVWYSVWNSGLGFFAEMKYRQIYGDSSYLPYADTCRQYCFAHPLNFVANTLHGNVTALAAGMMYRYALERNDPALRDTALAYGERVKAWAEAQPSRLRTGNWAMSGGTVLWGLCSSIWQADTAAGKAWLQAYADSVPYFMPAGQWNCSWNIWDANGFRAAAGIVHELRFSQYHQRLTDTLLGLDEDDDGGIPATWTDPQNQDQTWVSTYLDFMGMDVFAWPTYDRDAGVLAITGIDPNRIYLAGDAITLKPVVANLGRLMVTVPVTARLLGYSDTVTINNLPFLGTDTAEFGPIVLGTPGLAPITAFTDLAGDERRSNDTAYETLRVWTPRGIAGELRDSVSSLPIRGRIEFYLLGDSFPFDTLRTDTLGRFALTGIDSTFRVRVYPELPYPDRQWTVTIQGDTSLRFTLGPTNLLLVDNDTLARYENYYTSTFDTLGLEYCLWRRHRSGPLSARALTRLRDKLVVWYTGTTITRTLDTADMDSLTRFLDAGGRLFITGQNIGQEICSTAFYRNRLHARLVNPSVSLLYAHGNRSDSLGRQFGSTQTAGPSGANNQNSRDEIAPDSLARTFLLYDTITGQASGIYYHDPATQSRLIYLGFGSEALNRPANHPEFMSRATFFSECYAWLTGSSAINEPLNPNPQPPAPGLRVAPNPFRHQLRFSYTGTTAKSLQIFDASGRRVRTLPACRLPATVCGSATWDGRDNSGRLLPNGVYFYRIMAGPGMLTGTVELLR
jgi:hypothetical protein